MAVSLQTIEYKGWERCLRLSNGTVELVAPLEIGIRVMRYGLIGGPNVFKEYESQLGQSGEGEWRIRGGHRLWHAPEEDLRTYQPDNSPVGFERMEDGGLRLVQPVEALTGIEKELDITPDAEGSGVTIVHRLRNRNAWEVELAAWCLSVMAPGGCAIIPLPAKISHPGSLLPGEVRDLRGFVPNQNLVLWPFTDLSDSRYRWGARYITLRQESGVARPTKIGLSHRLGWVGYLNQGQLFVKEIRFDEGPTYPDGGSNFETFTNAEMLEIESLGPLTRIAPGGFIEHRERWWIMNNIPAETTDAAIDRHIRPGVEELLDRLPAAGEK